MKALILAGGKGTRLRPITFSMAKQLVPVANKPVIEFGIESIRAAGISDFGIIVGDTATEVREALGNGSRWNATMTFIQQSAPLGLAHAVSSAREFLGDDDFVMYLGDNLIKSSIEELVDSFVRERPAASILLTEVPNPSDFGVAEMDGDRVIGLEEKPVEPKSNFALVGVYFFDKRIHDVIATLQPSRRGEYEITDAIQGLINRGLVVNSRIVQGWWKDTGTVEAMLEANRLILEDMEGRIEGEIDEQSRLEGRVTIGKGSRIVNSVVRGPAIVGSDCAIIDSYVGPFTAIDDNCTVHKTEVENSIILQDCTLDEVGPRIESSLLGRGATVRRNHSLPKSMSLVMGDSSSVVLP